LAVTFPIRGRAATRPGSGGAAAPSVMVEAVVVPDASGLKLDGDLSDVLWEHARVIEGFKQREPREGEDATYPTEVRLLADATALYVAVRAEDPEPAKIVGHLTRRDEWSPSDWIRVIVDSYNDRRTAFEFAVNPAGVKADTYWFNDMNEDTGWDAVWEVATRRTERAWQAEFRIPYSQLRFPKNPDGRIGFAVFRRIARLSEVSSWPLVAQSRAGYVSQFGQLTNLTPGSAPRRLELVPYGVTQLGTNPTSDNPLVEPRDPDASAGLDLKYALTPGLTLTATVNPDFGQVEADPAVVNLTAFETFFQERRPFFVEGSGNFAFDLDCEDGACTGLFYSRRVGRAPQGEAEVPEGEYAESPAQTTIIGATKVTGRLGKFSIGAMNAITQEEEARITGPGGAISRQAVEPLTSYTVVRAKREFANNSNVGFMVTATNRRLSENLQDVLAGQAYTGGVDVDWRLTSKYQLTGYWAGSTIHGTPGAITSLQENSRHYFQRPDADHVELDLDSGSLKGHAGQVAFGKNGGQRVRFRSQVTYKSPGFDTNDVGYLRRADQRTMMNWLQWRFPTPTSWYRSVRLNFNQWGGWNFGGDRLFLGSNVNGHVQFLNNWRVGGGLTLNAEHFDDRLTRGGPGGLNPARAGNWFYVESDDRRRIVVNAFGFVGGDRHDSHNVEVSPSVTFRPTSALSIEPGVLWSLNRDDAQWVEQVEDAGTHYVFGELDQKTLALTLRVNYTIRPTLSVQVYAQPFVSAGDYDRYKELADGRAPRYEDRYRPYAYRGNADFNYASLRMTNVLRWEYRPGSTLFVVWQQSREDATAYGDFQFGRDVGHIFDTPAQNVFLVKVAYWFSM
jgi:hypothetical protein